MTTEFAAVLLVALALVLAAYAFGLEGALPIYAETR